MSLIKQVFGRLFSPRTPSVTRVEVGAVESTSDRAVVRIYGEIKHVQIAISDHAEGFRGMQAQPNEGSATQVLHVYFDVADCDCEAKSKCEHSAAARVCDAIANHLKSARLEFTDRETTEPSRPH